MRIFAGYAPVRRYRCVGTSGCSAAKRLGRLCEVAQHELQDAAVLEVFDLVERIDAAAEVELALAAVLLGDRADDVHARLDAAGDAFDVDHLRAVELQVG